MSVQERINAAVDAEAAKFARAAQNIIKAHEDGRVNENDMIERINRAEQWMINRVAFIKGEPRPAQRTEQPLDDPDAGTVG